MSSSTITPNMNLIEPTVGQEFGPQYAFDINNSLTLIDQHDHTPGKGVMITPAGININTSLPFNQNAATNVGSLQMFTNLSALSTINTIYDLNGDLYFIDRLGNNIQITKSGAVAGTPGSIANLVSPASATYVAGSSTFVWQSNAGIAANMDFGSALLRNLSPNSTFALTLAPPTLSSNYTITLPYLPSTKDLLYIDASGNMTATSFFDGSTIVDTGSVIKVPAQGITATQIANQTITATQIANNTITNQQLASTVTMGSLTRQAAFTTSGTWTAPAGVTFINVLACGGGGAGGGGGTGLASGGGGGGSGAPLSFTTITVVPATVYTITIGTGGVGILGPGGNGVATTFGTLATFAGGKGAPQAIAHAFGVGTAAQVVGGVGVTFGGNGGSGAVGAGTNGFAGEASVYAAGGIAGLSNIPGGSGAGGGGGASFGAGGAGGDSATGPGPGQVGTLGGGGGGGRGNDNGGIGADVGGNGGSGYLAVYY